MVLGFMTVLNGKPTHFVEKIWACSGDLEQIFAPKLHSIRAGNRWKAGMAIHMATGVRTKNYNRFNGGLIGLDVVKSVQTIEITDIGEDYESYHDGRKGIIHPYITLDGVFRQTIFTVKIDGRNIDGLIVKGLAINDGFETLKDFLDFFKDGFTGQIIHWTDLKY